MMQVGGRCLQLAHERVQRLVDAPMVQRRYLANHGENRGDTVRWTPLFGQKSVVRKRGFDNPVSLSVVRSPGLVGPCGAE